MSGQICFFKKSKCDYSLNPVATASEGSTYAPRALDRSNGTSWITTGSVDANNTTWTVDMSDPRAVDSVMLLKHNFKNFTVKYWNGSSYVDFSPAISVTNNTLASNYYAVASVSTSRIQITITGTQVVNADKYLYQFIATELIGRLNGWPISNPFFDKNKQSNQMLSGKLAVIDNLGGFNTELTVTNWNSDADLTIIETVYDSVDPVLVWPCGGVTSQFSSLRKLWRMEDIFLVRPTEPYNPAWANGFYMSGIAFDMKLSEVVS